LLASATRAISSAVALMPALACSISSERNEKPIVTAPIAMMTMIRSAYDAAIRVRSEVSVS
jgi:hypothetical protein